MRALYQITLDVQRIGVQATVNAKQNDTESRTVKIALTERGRPFTVPESAIAVLYAKKPDGTVLFNSCIKRGGFLYYTMTTQTVTAVGEVLAELKILDGDEVLYSPRFKIRVESALVPDSTIESTDEYTALTEAIEAAGNLAASVTKTGHTATISITDKDGTETTADVTSPTITVTEITGGHRVVVTDEDGVQTVDVLDGEKGDKGDPIKTIGGSVPFKNWVQNYTGSAGPEVCLTTSTFSFNFTVERTINGETVEVSYNGTTAPGDVWRMNVAYELDKIFSMVGEKGDKGDTGETGATGNGIASIVRTGTSGLVDTYTITYTDGNTGTYTVTNGEKGATGATGATGAAGPAGADGADGAEGFRIVDLMPEGVLYPKLQVRDHQRVEAEIRAEQIGVIDDSVGSHFENLGIDGLTDVCRHLVRVDFWREIFRFWHGTCAALFPPTVWDVGVMGRIVVVECCQITIYDFLALIFREIVRAVEEFDGDVTPRCEDQEIDEKRLEVGEDGFQECGLVAFCTAEGRSPEAPCAHKHDADFGIHFKNALHAAVGAEVFETAAVDASRWIEQDVVAVAQGFDAVANLFFDFIDASFADDSQVWYFQYSKLLSHIAERRCADLLFRDEGAWPEICRQRGAEDDGIDEARVVGQEKDTFVAKLLNVFKPADVDAVAQPKQDFGENSDEKENHVLEPTGFIL